jgi:hypothetical protein
MHTSTRTRGLQALLLATAATAVIGGTAYAATGAGSPPKARCDQGEFCTWQRAYYQGKIHRVDLRTTNPGECIPLTSATDGRSFANRTSRDITVYQGRDCSTEGDFTTYPGRGTFVPDAPFVVRAFQIWE